MFGICRKDADSVATIRVHDRFSIILTSWPELFYLWKQQFNA